MEIVASIELIFQKYSGIRAQLTSKMPSTCKIWQIYKREGIMKQTFTSTCSVLQ